jgi:hypothetical protein
LPTPPGIDTVPLRFQDGDGRLGRDAGHLAIDIAVQHQVADTGDVQPGDAVEQDLQGAQIQGVFSHEGELPDSVRFRYRGFGLAQSGIGKPLMR